MRTSGASSASASATFSPPLPSSSYHGHQQQQQRLQQSTPQPPQQQQPNTFQGTLPPGTRVQVGAIVVTVKRYLSQGGFAHVYLVTSQQPIPIPSSNSNHATEPHSLHVLKRMAVPDKQSLAIVRNEVEVHKSLRNHPNIVHFIEASASALPGGGYEVFILMEFCAGGGIIDLMNARLRNRLSEREVLKIFGDVANGLSVMHHADPPLLHRDLKVENILLSPAPSSDPARGPTYKLCDFGSAKPILSRNPPRSLDEVKRLEQDLNRATTLQYRAPEMVDVYQRRVIDEKADVWAMGVLLYKLCYYTTPFEENGGGPLAILNARYRFPPMPPYSQRLKDLVASMLQEHSSARPTIDEVILGVHRILGTEPPASASHYARLARSGKQVAPLPTLVTTTTSHSMKSGAAGARGGGGKPLSVSAAAAAGAAAAVAAGSSPPSSPGDSSSSSGSAYLSGPDAAARALALARSSSSSSSQRRPGDGGGPRGGSSTDSAELIDVAPSAEERKGQEELERRLRSEGITPMRRGRPAKPATGMGAGAGAARTPSPLPKLQSGGASGGASGFADSFDGGVAGGLSNQPTATTKTTRPLSSIDLLTPASPSTHLLSKSPSPRASPALPPSSSAAAIATRDEASERFPSVEELDARYATPSPTPTLTPATAAAGVGAAAARSLRQDAGYRAAPPAPAATTGAGTGTGASKGSGSGLAPHRSHTIAIPGMASRASLSSIAGRFGGMAGAGAGAGAGGGGGQREAESGLTAPALPARKKAAVLTPALTPSTTTTAKAKTRDWLTGDAASEDEGERHDGSAENVPRAPKGESIPSPPPPSLLLPNGDANAARAATAKTKPTANANAGAASGALPASSRAAELARENERLGEGGYRSPARHGVGAGARVGTVARAANGRGAGVSEKADGGMRSVEEEGGKRGEEGDEESSADEGPEDLDAPSLASRKAALMATSAGSAPSSAGTPRYGGVVQPGRVGALVQRAHRRGHDGGGDDDDDDRDGDEGQAEGVVVGTQARGWGGAAQDSCAKDSPPTTAATMMRARTLSRPGKVKPPAWVVERGGGGASSTPTPPPSQQSQQQAQPKWGMPAVAAGSVRSRVQSFGASNSGGTRAAATAAAAAAAAAAASSSSSSSGGKPESGAGRADSDSFGRAPASPPPPVDPAAVAGASVDAFEAGKGGDDAGESARRSSPVTAAKVRAPAWDEDDEDEVRRLTSPAMTASPTTTTTTTTTTTEGKSGTSGDTLSKEPPRAPFSGSAAKSSGAPSQPPVIRPKPVSMSAATGVGATTHRRTSVLASAATPTATVTKPKRGNEAMKPWEREEAEKRAVEQYGTLRRSGDDGDGGRVGGGGDDGAEGEGRGGTDDDDIEAAAEEVRDEVWGVPMPLHGGGPALTPSLLPSASPTLPSPPLDDAANAALPGPTTTTEAAELSAVGDDAARVTETGTKTAAEASAAAVPAAEEERFAGVSKLVAQWQRNAERGAPGWGRIGGAAAGAGASGATPDVVTTAARLPGREV